MSERRQVWETLSTLLARLEQEVETALDKGSTSDAALGGLKKEVRRLGKAQFKANTLAEAQGDQWEQAVASVQTAREQHAQLLETVVDERVVARERELLETVLPALDGLEHAIASGQRYLGVRDRAARSPNVSPEQAILVSPADRAMLSGWLNGLRMVRERLLAILEAGDVTSIPTVGELFDPYLHVAVSTTSEGKSAPGTIVAEERRGYRTAGEVLRYAEVIVYRPEG